MKRTIIMLMLIFVILSTLSVTFAGSAQIKSTKDNENTTTMKDNSSQLLEIKENSESKMDEYIERYGSESYGLTAFILDSIRLYSIPCCFTGIAVGAIYQYAIGTRRLDMKHKGFKLILSFVTILAVCQVLPLVYTLIVIGWRT